MIKNASRSLLQKLDYQVEAVASGKQAIAYLQTHSADLLLLDMIMDPGMDGQETYERILEIRPGMKAIIASGYKETERVNRLRNWVTKAISKSLTP